MFDLKQGSGGIADIEFIVQYLVLANAASDESLYFYSDNIRQLEALAAAGYRPMTLCGAVAGYLQELPASACTISRSTRNLPLVRAGRIRGDERSFVEDAVERGPIIRASRLYQITRTYP